jgi:hypothetical protein
LISSMETYYFVFVIVMPSMTYRLPSTSRHQAFYLFGLFEQFWFVASLVVQ